MVPTSKGSVATLAIVITLALLAAPASGYLELPLFRVPHSAKQIHAKSLPCPNATDTTNNENTEICYLKDINYAVQLYHKDLLYLFAVDFTAPISWIKHPEQCITSDEKKPCTRIDVPLKETIKKKFSRNNRKNKPSEATNQQIVTIQGMEPISGILEKSEDIEFTTKDYGKFFSIYKIFLIGLFLSDEKELIKLNHTNFLNATRITQHTSSLADGALSFRFDEQSQKSFLDECFAFVDAAERYVTVFLGKQNPIVTIGDLSVKNSETGYSGIEWLSLDSARFPVVAEILLQTPNVQKPKKFGCEVEAVFTLSASYISLPERELKALIIMLNSGCSLRADGFLVCNINIKDLLKKKLILDMGDISVSVQIQEIVRESAKKNVTLNIRQSESKYMILGEPIMQKYLTVFDYTKNRIGLAPRRVTIVQQIIDVITLIRFLVFVFSSGVLFLLCYKPVKRTIKTFKLYRQLQENSGNLSRDSERTGLRYQGVQENSGYEDIKQKIQELVSDDVQNL